MINLIGKWKAAEMIDFNAEKGTMDWTKVEDILAKDDLDKDTRFMANMVVVFGEDGTITMLTPLPEGVSQAEVDAAVKAGQLERASKAKCWARRSVLGRKSKKSMKTPSR